MKTKIGETFYYKNTKLRIEISKSNIRCFGCFFAFPYCHKPIDIGDCVENNKEGINIIFKKVNT